ncbi:hypothetical protein SAMN04489859_102137 [Paracoccus alcaliphilus]|uniref:Uncharacterized protein n=1 Tax=Paracoccus alcaliphilus TaxID=34002 RepID=A0A1H8KC68_9RHOB|nr:hypothetical protein [Paracoccus alcaliphilus]WCR17061.1 hypothetical protein JHW40_11745 [Paracoccus alcaliphilus]SEN89998.1 hypothetical protein SAMN04489859_102137 [Paracoccus alcaliphilus]
MAVRIETKLKRLIVASQEVGRVVIGAEIEGEKINLIFETPKDTMPADFIDWRRKK